MLKAVTELEPLLAAAGGTVQDRAIEIQGDQPGKIRAIEAEGFLVAGVS
jgi:translation initiation factor 1 (eIF-1/SUI1)